MGQFLAWLFLIAPWFLLIPLDSKRVRRYLAVAFFTILLITIYFQMGELWNWWTVPINVFFLKNISSYTYGFLPVITILIFYFTYQNVWLFFGVNIFIDAIFAFLFKPFVLEKFGLSLLNRMSYFGLFLLIFSLVPIIFLFQKWYEKE